MGILNKLNDYAMAVGLAKEAHKVSTISALASVITAKVIYNMGPRMHSLYGLSAVPRVDWKNYQRQDDLEALLLELNPKSKRNVSKDKIAFSKHCEAHGIAHIKTIYCDSQLADVAENVRRCTFCDCLNSGPDRIFLKLIDGAHGHGAFSAERKNGQWYYCGVSGSTETLYDFCQQRKGKSIGWLVQPVLETHVSLQDITTANALSTARVVTCLTPQGPELLFSLFKLARGNNQNDNFDLGRAGNMVAEIDIETGKLGPAKGALRKGFPSIISFDSDPDTGEKITGKQIPFWSEAKAALLYAQSTLPELKSIGWDMAITDNGAVLVEANSNYGGEIVEVAYGKGLKPVFLNRLQALIEPG